MTQDDLTPAPEERVAHYAKKEDLARGLETGEAVIALCGKRWVPTEDPEKYPTCPTCREILDLIPKE